MIKLVIVGSGVVGSTIAYELSHNPQYQITLIDKKIPGEGSTGAALGILMGVISHKTKGRAWQLREMGLQRFKTLLPQLQEITGIKIPCNYQGIVKLLFPEDNLDKWQKLSKIREQQGYKLEIWDQQQLKENCPEIDVNKVIGAVYSPDDCQISPPILTRALVRGAALNGVKCQFGQSVTGFEVKDNQCTIVKVGTQEIEADWVILASGLGTHKLTQLLNCPLVIKPVLGQALLLKDGALQNQIRDEFQPVITGNDIHIVRVGNDEFWLGATVEFPDDENKVVPDDELLENLKQQAIAFCPSLESATTMISWTGKRPRPEGKPAPVIEKLGSYNNIIVATGHYRNGVLLAPGTAKLVLEIMDS
jgi:glycine/D-amino acid oxidase-like deaminating enzyme